MHCQQIAQITVTRSGPARRPSALCACRIDRKSDDRRIQDSSEFETALSRFACSKPDKIVSFPPSTLTEPGGT